MRPRAFLLIPFLAAACASPPAPPPTPAGSRPPGEPADARPVLDLAGRVPAPGATAEPRGLLPPGDDPAVAEVDGRPVRASDVARFLFRYDPGRALEGLNQILDDRILEADAGAAGVTVPAGEVEARAEEEVRRRETEIRVQFGPATTLDGYLRERYGFTEAAYRRDVAALVRLQALRDRLVRVEALREERIRVRVLVTKTEEEAREAAGRLRGGADFAAVARQVSLAPVEELPPYARSEIEPAELAAELFAMEPGEISRPVRVARDGKEVFQVFKVTERRPARTGTWAEVAEEIERGLRERPVSPAEYLQWARRARERHGVKVLLEEPAAGEEFESMSGESESAAGAAGTPGPAPRQVLEALLFAADAPIPLDRLREAAGIEEAKAARDLLDGLRKEYEEGGRAFALEEVAGGWQLLTRPAYAPFLARLHRRPERARLTQAALETLAVVAYRQPVLRTDVERVRGVACGEMIRALMERDLVRVAGRAEEPGAPILYGTTTRFLAEFGLRGLKDLPTARDLPPPPGTRIAGA